MRGNKTYHINEYLQVRPITPADTEAVVTWRNRDFVRNNFIFREPFTAKMHENWLASKVDTGLVEQFIIECRRDYFDPQEETREELTFVPVGSVYLRDVDETLKQAEYGIFLGEKKALGKGIGSRVAKWAVWYAREELKLKTLLLRVFADNERAVKSYEQAGFVPVERKKDFLTEGGRSRDLIFMVKDLIQ